MFIVRHNGGIMEVVGIDALASQPPRRLELRSSPAHDNLYKLGSGKGEAGHSSLRIPAALSSWILFAATSSPVSHRTASHGHAWNVRDVTHAASPMPAAIPIQLAQLFLLPSTAVGC